MEATYLRTTHLIGHMICKCTFEDSVYQYSPEIKLGKFRLEMDV